MPSTDNPDIELSDKQLRTRVYLTGFVLVTVISVILVLIRGDYAPVSMLTLFLWNMVIVTFVLSGVVVVLSIPLLIGIKVVEVVRSRKGDGNSEPNQ